MPATILQSTSYVTGLWNSPRVVAPSTQWIISPSEGEPVHTFYPLRELRKSYKAKLRGKGKKKALWELVIVNASGRNFRRFSGEGLPPESLTSDGKGDDGKWLKVGQIYSAVVTFTDSEGRSHTALSPAFSLTGLKLPVPGGHVISLASKILFDASTGSLELTDHGKSILRETAQLIQRLHPGLSIEVASHLSRADAGNPTASGLCAGVLTERLLLAKGSVTTSSHPGTSDLEERVDVLILNR